MLERDDNFVVSRFTDGRCRTHDAHHSSATNSAEPLGGDKRQTGNGDDDDDCNCPVQISRNERADQPILKRDRSVVGKPILKRDCDVVDIRGRFDEGGVIVEGLIGVVVVVVVGVVVKVVI